MATVLERAHPLAGLSRAARRSSRVVLELPSLPLLGLTLLTVVAVFAPILAPHGALDPVKPTAEQCRARYGSASCPYVDYVPPLWSAQGRLDTPLGTDFLGRDVLTRLMYGARI